MNLKIIFSTLSLVAAAHSTMAQGLRGVTVRKSSKTHRNLMGGGMGGSGCSTQTISQAEPIYCEPGQRSSFNFRTCAWQCSDIPVTSPQYPGNAQPVPQTRSATPPQATLTSPEQPAPQARKGGKGSSCSTQDIALAQPVYCEPGQRSSFNFRSCAWQCSDIPQTSPQYPGAVPQTRSATPEQAIPTARKGGKGGSTLCQYHDNQLQNPMIKCEVGQAAMFNHRDCSWVCKQMPAMTTSSFDTIPQTRSATPEQATSPTQTAPTARKGGSKLCQYHDNQLQNPMVECQPGEAAVFNHKDCVWMCKQMPVTEAPQAIQSAIECPPHHIPIFDNTQGAYECLAIPDIECPPGQHIAFDNEQDAFYCAV